jgi:dihydrofolate reductase
MSRTQYYTATSLDGFIATPDNSLDWLVTREQDRTGLLNYADFIAEVGALAMGSTTYEWILEHEFADRNPADWEWPYQQPCRVFTHRDLPTVPRAGHPVRPRPRGSGARDDGGRSRRAQRVDRRRW